MGIIISIVIALISDNALRKKIQNHEEFSGIGWALLNGILGVGILWVMAVYFDAKKEMKKLSTKTKKEKDYQEYTKTQLHDFKITTIVCTVIWIIILAIIYGAGAATSRYYY